MMERQMQLFAELQAEAMAGGRGRATTTPV